MSPTDRILLSLSRAGALLTALAGCEQAPDRGPAPPAGAAPSPRPADPEPGAAEIADPCGTNPRYPVAVGHRFPAAVPPLCNAARQRNFDFFGWQEFVALNWPADAEGRPIAGKTIGQEPRARRVWQGFMGPSAVFLPGGAEPTWRPGAGIDVSQQSKSSGGTAFIDATYFPVVDRSNNFIVFTLGMNKVMFDYIVANKLHSVAGQRTPDCRTADGTGRRLIQFPAGAVEVKAAWRIFPGEPSAAEARQLARYHHYATSVRIKAINSATGKERVEPVNLALVGFHVAQKTAAEHQWTWATFEHVDNLASGGGFPSTFATEGPPTRSNLPPIPPGGMWDPARPLKPHDRPYIWARDMSAGYAAGNAWTPTVIARQNPIPSAADSPGLNAQWQAALRERVSGSPWANYQLISVQWPTAPGQPRACADLTNPTGQPAPRILANIPIEVYNQRDRHGVAASSCIDCHSKAFTRNGDYADFSYLLQFAQ